MLHLLFYLLALQFVIADSTVVVNPTPEGLPPRCNIYYKSLYWVLEDCVCRPIQNSCLASEEDSARLRENKTPLVPVTEELCKFFIPTRCRKGRRVIAQFTKPPGCGCNGKPGSIVYRQFRNICELIKYSALNNAAYISYSFIEKNNK